MAASALQLLRCLQRGRCNSTATPVVAAAAIPRHDLPFAAVDMANARPSLLGGPLPPPPLARFAAPPSLPTYLCHLQRD